MAFPAEGYSDYLLKEEFFFNLEILVYENSASTVENTAYYTNLNLKREVSYDESEIAEFLLEKYGIDVLSEK